MRAFVAVRHVLANPAVDRVGQLENQVKELKVGVLRPALSGADGMG